MPLVRRRRPLLRAAAVGGAAYMGKRSGEKRASSEGQYSQEEAPAAPGGITPASTTQLNELASLHDRGVLTDAEFEQQKRAILGNA